MKQDAIRMKCDTCRRPASTYDDAIQAESAGWVFFQVTDYYDDRSYTEHHICPMCATGVRKALIERAKDHGEPK